MKMKKRSLVVGAVSVALAGGTAAAVAATSDHKAAEDAILSDAAKQLGVSREALRSALADAEDAQLDAQVKAGRLTQEQADAIKQHRRSEGTVLAVPGGGHHGGPFGHHGGPGGRFGELDAAAKALGLTTDGLLTRLRSGKTLAQVAKAQGTSLAEVQAAVRRAVTEGLKADLDAGRITQAQYDEEVAEIDEHLARLGEKPVPGHDHDGDGDRHRGFPPPAPDPTP